MLTRQIIQEIAATIIYNRDFDLFRTNKMLTSYSEVQHDEIHMTAAVQGSGRKKYKVELTYNTFYESLIECFCNCPAFYSYDGICKHCAAVLLKDESSLDMQPTIFDYIEDAGHRRRLSDYLGPRDGRFLPRAHAKETTPVFRDLLRRRRMQPALPFMQDTPYEKVSLEPHFAFSENAFQLNLKSE